MNSKDLCAWLRENSSGAYRPAAEAADRIEQLEAALRAAQDDMEQVGMYDDKIDYVSHEKAVAMVGAALDACES